MKEQLAKITVMLQDLEAIESIMLDEISTSPNYSVRVATFNLQAAKKNLEKVKNGLKTYIYVKEQKDAEIKERLAKVNGSDGVGVEAVKKTE